MLLPKVVVEVGLVSSRFYLFRSLSNETFALRMARYRVVISRVEAFRFVNI
jgi:hypothetical protein